MLKLVLVAIILANGVFINTSAKSQARCKKGEVWEECPESQCYPLTCSDVGFRINCPSPSDDCNCWGDPGCICSDGKVRDDNGNCINPEDCPECGGDPNAVVVPCARLCPDDVPCATVCIPNTCECRKGYEPGKHSKKCVPCKDSTPACGPNEVFSTCANGGCGKWNCTQIGEPDLCIDPYDCKGGCICKKGYLRAKDGTCVPEDQCYTDVCPKNEIYDLCPASCPRRTCGLDDRVIKCIRPLPVGDPNCPPPKCRCKDGFYRNNKGHCVTWDQCPKCNGAYEVYDECPDTCPPQTCESIGKVYSCPAKTDPPTHCEGQCMCEPGYYRNKKGECISKKDCSQDQCTKPNEEYQQCPDCNPGTCDSIGKTYHCPLRPCQQTDKGECRCKSGFYRNKCGDCVTKQECTKEQCNKPNEEYQQCVEDCSPGTCESIGKSYNCPAHPDCSGQCRCKPGYFRNKVGDCITKAQCLLCNGTHEYFTCGPPCDNVCATLDIQNKTNCPIKNKRCNEKCYCEDGYARDGDNVCVPIDQCKEHCSKPNEIYHLCPPKCPPRRCDVDEHLIDCAAPPKVGDPEFEPGCICADGFVRNDKAPACQTNEIFSNCIQALCRALNCTQIGQPIACSMIADGYCIKGCVCAENYLRASNGTCVPEDQCDAKCNGAHEIYDECPDTCPLQTCESIGKVYSCPAKTDPPTHCEGQCMCEPGYYRNKKGECISKKDCSQDQCTKPNEEYQQCPDCNPETCDSIGKTYHCPLQPCKQTDKGECRCKSGFYRNKCGDCVTEQECTKEQCNKPNEEYQQCVEDCSPGTCESIGKSYSCPAHPDCSGQCRCKPGYFRNKAGDCITKAQCLQCSGPNEFYSCGGACDNVCSDLSQNQTYCHIINIKCNEKCYCFEGYARDDCNVCIPIDQCPPETTTTTTTAKPTSSPAKCPIDGLQKLLAGSFAFTAKFIYELVKNNPTTSVIASPFSVLTPMGELALYSKDDTYNELIKVLNLGSKDEIRCVFSQLTALLSDQKGVLLNIAVRIFANAEYPLSENFLDDCKSVFKAEAENLNFNDAAGAADRINKWVEDETNNRIQNIASPDMFSAATRLVLANAIYFLGNWKHQFNPNKTEDRDFHRVDNSIKKLPTMYQEESFRYGSVDDLDCQLLELPYNGSFSLLIILPNKNDGVLDLMLNLQDTSVFYDAYDSMKYETVQVYLPKFNVTTETDLSDILPKTGITEIFNTNGAGFSSILKNDEPLFVSAAKQKAFITVNEVGTEAAAANVIVGTASGASLDIQVFNADHPFVFYILQHLQNQNNVLFCGAYTGT